MVIKKARRTELRGRPLRPKAEDILRAIAYATIAIWAVLFLVYPPIAQVAEVDVVTRTVWMGVTFLGASSAFFGAILRIDLKLELPGIIFSLIGPIFYWASQVYFTAHQPVSDPAPNLRIALSAYALIPLFLLLPRLVALVREAHRQKSINTNKLRLAARAVSKEK